MQSTDMQEFGKLMDSVYEFYGKRVTADALEIWWVAMRGYDLPAVRDALGRHVMNPDSGQYAPKPADVVKMMGGSTIDTALVAWHKVDDAVRKIGPFQSVTFDDPLVMRVIEEMGGWTSFGTVTDKEWGFKQNEFVNRYRGYKSRNERPAHKPWLVGISDAHNMTGGYSQKPEFLVFVGDRERAKAVLDAGTAHHSLGFTRIALPAPGQAPAKESA